MGVLPRSTKRLTKLNLTPKLVVVLRKPQLRKLSKKPLRNLLLNAWPTLRTVDAVEPTKTPNVGTTQKSSALDGDGAVPPPSTRKLIKLSMMVNLVVLRKPLRKPPQRKAKRSLRKAKKLLKKAKNQPRKPPRNPPKKERKPQLRKARKPLRKAKRSLRKARNLLRKAKNQPRKPPKKERKLLRNLLRKAKNQPRKPPRNPPK